MLSPLEYVLVSMVVDASSIDKDATREAEFKNHLKWAQENFAATRDKIAALQQEEKETTSCSSKKCPIKNLQIPAENERKIQESLDKETAKILVFVSFSMPEASLKSLAQEAERANAVLIIRGLVEDSFKVTMTRLKDYALSVDINPDLFEQYDIQHVPTFVKLKDGQEQARLSGNVTLRACLESI